MIIGGGHRTGIALTAWVGLSGLTQLLRGGKDFGALQTCLRQGFRKLQSTPQPDDRCAQSADSGKTAEGGQMPIGFRTGFGVELNDMRQQNSVDASVGQMEFSADGVGKGYVSRSTFA